MGRKQNVNVKGRNNQQRRFTLVPHRIQKSEAYVSLSPTARCLLFELAMIENGKNNGSLYLSVRDATDRLGLADQKATMQAFDDLTDRGLIICSKNAHFEIKASEQSRARCWALTWLPRGRKIPTNDWENYTAPPKTSARKRADRGLRAHKRYLRALTSHRLPVVKSSAHPPLGAMISQQAAGESTAAKGENGGNLGNSVAKEFSAHTAVTIPTLQGRWWQGGRYAPNPLSLARAANQNWT